MTQHERVLHMLQNATGGWITTQDIREAGIVNGPERIAKLRRDGHRIEDETIKIRGKRAARYRLARDAREERRVVVDAAPPAENLFPVTFEECCPPARPSVYFDEAA
jgi:hypothetical protein